MPLASVLLFALGGTSLLAGIAAAFVLAPPDGTVNWWFLVPGLVLGAAFEIAAVVVAVLTRRNPKR